jgi:hypothetical protein
MAQQSDEEMAVYYKVTDPIHFFIRKADDFKRRPRESDASFERRKITTAKRRCARWLKKYPKHTKGHIDRASTIGWSQPRGRKMAKKKAVKKKKYIRKVARCTVDVKALHDLRRRWKNLAIEMDKLHNNILRLTRDAGPV